MTYVAAPDRYDAGPATFRRCGRSGLDLPAISLGLWHNFGDDRSLEGQRAILRRAFDRGITHFDLANNYGPPYGSAEQNFGTIFAQDFGPYRDELKDECPDCEILYSNADQDAAKQQQQAEAAITNGAEVLVLDPVDAESASVIAERANQSDIPILSYDRLVQNADLDAYVSFDNERVGRLQGEWMVENVDEGGNIVMINGAPTDPNAGLFKQGAHSVIDQSSLEVGVEYDTPDWSPDEAQSQMDQAITRLGRENIDGVYAANDGTSGGAIAAMRAAGVEPLPPTTGQDAELDAVQRVLAGTQGMTVYKAIRDEATTAAEIAVSLLDGGELPQDLETTGVDNGQEEVPSVLLEPVVVTADDVQDTILADEFYRTDEICTPEFEDACREAGITG